MRQKINKKILQSERNTPIGQPMESRSDGQMDKVLTIEISQE
jgi:hypothetical protein